MSQVLFDYTRQDATGASTTAHAWARLPATPTAGERATFKARAKALLQQHNAVLVAHYYVDGDLQDLAQETGGCVADSLEMARFGRDHAAQTLVVAGVRFMGESAKILSPDKRVLMPDLDATCSLDLGCPPDQFAAFCDAHPDRTVVVYANTGAAVKARADWMVTSSCALAIVKHLKDRGEKILWAPDRHLGRYIQEQTGADMLSWHGECIVHDEFKGIELDLLRKQHPLIHRYWHDANVQVQDFTNEGVVVSSSWPFQVNTLQANKQPVASVIPEEGASGWADTTMLAANAKHPNCAYKWMEWSLNAKVQGDVASWFGSVPAVPAACKGNALLTDKGCATNGFDKFDKIHFWRTPEAACSTGTCVPYSRWATDYVAVMGGR